MTFLDVLEFLGSTEELLWSLWRTLASLKMFQWSLKKGSWWLQGSLRGLTRPGFQVSYSESLFSRLSRLPQGNSSDVLKKVPGEIKGLFQEVLKVHEVFQGSWWCLNKLLGSFMKCP